MKGYYFHTTCVDSNAESIHAMTDQAIDVTYRTMRKHCPELIDWAVSVGYAHHHSQGLTLKSDGYVSYHRSKYRGKKCYYLRWSGIEVIFSATS